MDAVRGKKHFLLQTFTVLAVKYGVAVVPASQWMAAKRMFQRQSLSIATRCYTCVAFNSIEVKHSDTQIQSLSQLIAS